MSNNTKNRLLPRQQKLENDSLTVRIAGTAPIFSFLGCAKSNPQNRGKNTAMIMKELREAEDFQA